MGCLGGEMDKDQDQRKEDLRRIGENWHLSDADLEEELETWKGSDRGGRSSDRPRFTVAQ